MQRDTIIFRQDFGPVHPGNVEQITQAQLQLLANGIREASKTTDARNRAESLIRQAAIGEYNQVGEVNAIARFTQNFRFTKDPAYVEWIQTVSRLSQRKMGDCDCKLHYAGSLLASIGYPVAILALATNPRTPGIKDHVMLAVRFNPPIPRFGGDTWVPVELTRKGWQVGDKPDHFDAPGAPNSGVLLVEV